MKRDQIQITGIPVLAFWLILLNVIGWGIYGLVELVGKVVG